jgi:glycosyltransferase involved in cell wall biosynthesis
MTKDRETTTGQSSGGYPEPCLPRRRIPNGFRLSVAIPIYNEESVLPELFRRLRIVLDQVDGGPHEIIFVDDGSTDGSRELLAALATADTRVKAVFLSRNFGHQSALSAALDHVTGDAVVLMDGDLQDTPETIFRFLEVHQQGFDVVYAVREKRKEAWWLKTAYAGFYRVIGKLSELNLPEGSGDFALLSRRVVDRMCALPERHRYLRGLRTWVGYKQTGITVERDARHSGVSKYSLWKLFQLAFDGIFSFSVKPLRAATFLGFLTITASLAFVAFAIFAHLFLGRSPEGFTSLITATTFFTGVQLFFLGVIGEYVGRIYEQVKLRPMYVVDRVLTADNADVFGVSYANDGMQSENIPTRVAQAQTTRSIRPGLPVDLSVTPESQNPPIF